MIQYHIVEIQNRDDGINNVLDIVTRNSLASGLSYYYDRCSKMVGTNLFTTVTLILIDSDGKVYKNKNLTTAYEPGE